MVDEQEFTRWRRSADEALAAARVQADAGQANWACFLAEQAAQLAMKALLHGLGAGAWGHDLVALGAALAATVDDDLPQPVAGALRRLSRHYIPARYPDAHPSGSPGSHYGPEDTQAALADVGEVVAYVDHAWSQVLDALEGET